MGVHGLTTFVSKYHEQYKERIYLRDCPVIIDGSNLMYHLYFQPGNLVSKQTVPKTPNAYLFGGDWEHFAQNVRHFFQQLKECKILGIVVMDGAYDSTKFATAVDRFKQSVGVNVRPCTRGKPEPGKKYTPIFLKTVFLEVVSEQKIPHYQTLGEADCTIAYIARLLGDCPILSSDSDFAIYVNSKAFPLNTLKFARAAQGKKGVKTKDSASNDDNLKATSLPTDKVMTLQAEYVPLRKLCKKEFKLRDVRLLPLAAVILGNDTIERKVLRQIQRVKPNGHTSKTVDGVESVMKWISKQQSLESVIRTILSNVREDLQVEAEAAIRTTLAMYEGNEGEERIWSMVKTDVDLNRWIKTEMQELRSGDAVEDLCLQVDDLTVSEEITNGDSESFDVEEVEKSQDDCIDEESISLKSRHLESKACEAILPAWYLKAHSACEYHSYLLNLYKNQVVFFPPQVEIFDQGSTHNLSIPVVRVCAGILLGGGESVKVITRRKGRMIEDNFKSENTIQGLKGNLPALFDTELGTFRQDPFRTSVPHERRLEIVLRALSFNLVEMDYVSTWPAASRIWVATVLSYGSKKLSICEDEPSNFDYPLFSLVLFVCIIKNLVVNPGDYKDPVADKNGSTGNDNGVHHVYRATKNDPVKLKTLRQFYTKFESTAEVSSSKFIKSYDIEIGSGISEYLCLLFHTSMLNSLLDCPLRSPKIRYTMNNFLVYNLYNHVRSCSRGVDFKKYIVNLMGVPEMMSVLLSFESRLEVPRLIS